MPSVCAHPTCSKCPIYGIINERPLYCGAHKGANHVNVKSKRCIYRNCTKTPSFNNSKSKIPLYCETHKRKGHINVVRRRCAFEGCTVSPSFNVPRAKSGILCVKHKKEGYVDVTQKRCRYEGCTTRPVFGAPGTKRTLYCSIHKAPDHVDVKNKRCASEGCETQPSFGEPGGPVTYCYKHKGKGHVSRARSDSAAYCECGTAVKPGAVCGTCDFLREVICEEVIGPQC